MSIPTEVKQSETKVTEQTTTTQVQPAVVPKEAEKPPEETQEQINWRKFRQVREQERKAREEADRKATEKEAEANALKAAMEALLNKQSTQSHATIEEPEETEEQRIDKRVHAALAREKEKNDRERARQEESELPQKLAATFNDFNQVCTQENLDYLEYHYPEVAAGFKHSPESFDKWANVYKAVKRFIPNTDSRKDMARMEKNLNKPQSMSAPGATQTGDQAPSELNEKRRQDNWARMQRVLKGVK